MTPTQKSTFDFGNGPVPAHQHSNGGGWVADTAKLSETAYVGLNAQVAGDARVYGNAQVLGNARVYGNAQVLGGKWVESPPQAQIGRWYASMQSENVIAIGCQVVDISEATGAWVMKLADEHKATATEIALAKSFVATCRKLFYRPANKKQKKEEAK